jgi:magnesium-transporting ATPase (P-type)
MMFKKCSIDGTLFKDVHDNLVCEDPDNFNERSVRRFLEVLSLCHTVQAANDDVRNPHDIDYNASSPDEKAIVEACRNYGVAFLGESEKNSKVYLIQTFEHSCFKMFLFLGLL